MNMSKMESETKGLETVIPSRFVKAYCSFWMDCFSVYKQHLPESHIKKNEDFSVLISIEAADGFRRCFNSGYTPKIDIFEVKG